MLSNHGDFSIPLANYYACSLLVSTTCIVLYMYVVYRGLSIPWLSYTVAFPQYSYFESLMEVIGFMTDHSLGLSLPRSDRVVVAVEWTSALSCLFVIPSRVCGQQELDERLFWRFRLRQTLRHHSIAHDAFVWHRDEFGHLPSLLDDRSMELSTRFMQS